MTGICPKQCSPMCPVSDYQCNWKIIMKPEFFIGGELNGQDRRDVFPDILDNSVMLVKPKTLEISDMVNEQPGREEYWKLPISLGAEEWTVWVYYKSLPGNNPIAIATAFSLILSNHFEVCSKKSDGNG
jgi:hypothetical protein